MRTLLPTIVAALLCGPLQAQQAPAIEWERSFGGTAADWFNAVVNSNDSGLVFVGFSISSDGDATFNHGSRDFWVVKADEAGTLLWQHSYGGSDWDTGTDIYATTDGGYIVAGITRSNDGDILVNQGGEDVWVLKLNAQGNVQWKKTFGGPGDDGANAVIQTSDGGYLLAGYSGAIGGDVTTNYGQSDHWLIKLSSSGTMQWQRSLGSLSDDEALDVIEVSGGGFVVAGHAYAGADVSANNGQADMWVVKVNSVGDILWERSYGGSLGDYARSITQVQDGGFIVIGSANSSNGYTSVNYGIFDVWLVRLDADGFFLWDASFGGTVADHGTSIIQASDGNYVIAGFTFSTNGHVENNNGANDYWIIKTDGSGELLWQRTMGGSEIDNAHDLVQTADGGFVLVGYSSSNNGDISAPHGGVGSDAWVVKLEADELYTNVRSSTDRGMVSIYPNPANDQVQIIFTDAKDAQFPVELLDANGRAIPTSAYGVARNGRSSITLHIGDLPQGMYIVKAATGDGVVVGRLLKI